LQAVAMYKKTWIETKNWATGFIVSVKRKYLLQGDYYPGVG
jgi:hypothetical protein